MKVFVVIGYLTGEFANLESALAEHYPNATYKAREGIWLVRSGDTTTKDVSDRLGITPSGVGGSGLVVGMNGYFGRWRPDVWEWLNVRPEPTDG